MSKITDAFWTTEACGSSFPPINWSEIISEANELIQRSEYPEQFSDDLWEEFCMTGKVGNVVAIYEEEK